MSGVPSAGPPPSVVWGAAASPGGDLWGAPYWGAPYPAAVVLGAGLLERLSAGGSLVLGDSSSRCFC